MKSSLKFVHVVPWLPVRDNLKFFLYDSQLRSTTALESNGTPDNVTTIDGLSYCTDFYHM